MSTAFRIPGYCVHSAKQQAYVRLNGEMLYLGAPGSPQSKAKYDRLIGEWIARGRSHVKPTQGQGISVNEILLAYRRFAETYYADAEGPNRPSWSESIWQSVRSPHYTGRHRPKFWSPRAQDRAEQNDLSESLPAHSQSCINCVRRIFRWAVEEELLHPPSFMGSRRCGD